MVNSVSFSCEPRKDQNVPPKRLGIGEVFVSGTFLTRVRNLIRRGPTGKEGGVGKKLKVSDFLKNFRRFP